MGCGWALINLMIGVLTRRNVDADTRRKKTTTRRQRQILELRPAPRPPPPKCQGLLATTRCYREGMMLPKSLWRQAMPHWLFDFGLLASRTGREQISIVISHPVCGNLLWQP